MGGVRVLLHPPEPAAATVYISDMLQEIYSDKWGCLYRVNTKTKHVRGRKNEPIALQRLCLRGETYK